MKRAWSWTALCATLAAMVAIGGCEWNPIDGRGKGTALMLIGLQRDYLQADGRKPVAQDQVAPLIQAANAMIAAARADTTLVFYVRDEASPFQFISNHYRDYATPRLWGGSQIDPRVDAYAGPYFNKSRANAFCNDKLQTWLDEQNIGRLAIGGVYANHAVEATVRTAIKRGYKVTVISDALAAGSAEQRDAAINAMKSAGATVETSQQFIAELKPSDTLGLRGPLTGAWWLLRDKAYTPPKSESGQND